jgi:L-aminopeptidase/D-esterase-like protein
MGAHDGYARSIDPVHTMYDGDTIFCVANGDLEADISLLSAVAAQVMARAVANAVLSARSLAGVPGYEEIRARRA